MKSFDYTRRPLPDKDEPVKAEHREKTIGDEQARNIAGDQADELEKEEDRLGRHPDRGFAGGAVESVRAAGGQLGEVSEEKSGKSAGASRHEHESGGSIFGPGVDSSRQVHRHEGTMPGTGKQGAYSAPGGARIIEQNKYEVHQPGKGQGAQKDFDDSVAYEEVQTQLEMLGAPGIDKHIDAVPCTGDEELCQLLDEEYDEAGQEGNIGGG